MDGVWNVAGGMDEAKFVGRAGHMDRAGLHQGCRVLGGQLLEGRGRGLGEGGAKVVISGLTGMISIILGAVNLQFQGPFVPISLQSVLRIVASHVLDTV